MVADQLVALVNEPSERMCHEGLCTFINRKSFSHSQALREHREFCSALEGVGIPVRDLRINADCPDAAFVEDNARVFDDGHLLLASMTHPARRAEMAGWEQVLEMDREFRSLFSNITFLYREDEDARIEFGDVLSVGRRHFVGLSTRTNRRGYELFSDFVRQYGHETVPVECTKALHLDTAVARINENTVLLNRNWVESRPFVEHGLYVRFVDPSEPFAANRVTLRTNGHVVQIAPKEYPKTNQAIEREFGDTVQILTVPYEAHGAVESGPACKVTFLPRKAQA